MAELTSTQELIPESGTLPQLAEAAAGCKACPLWQGTTQTVFGEGLKKSAVMLVGEQPGDREDLAGKPFVGPAGRILDQALEQVGIERKLVYVTNVVKHFKYEQRGKRRIHKKPNMSEITACRPWLDAELEQVKPEIVVALGATAAQALLGKDFKVSRQRGGFVEQEDMPIMTATVHPSSIIRMPDDAKRHSEMKEFVKDLRKVAAKMNGS